LFLFVLKVWRNKKKLLLYRVFGANIYALQKQTINKTEYKISIMKSRKLVTLFLLYKENGRNKNENIYAYIHKSRKLVMSNFSKQA